MKWLKAEADIPEKIKDKVTKDDVENLKIDLQLEHDAVQIYDAHIKNSKRENIKKLLEHIKQEELGHIQELEQQLANIDKELTEEELHAHENK